MDSTKRPFTAKDLYQIQIESDPQISPNGQWIVYCIQRVDQQTEKKYSNLWLVPSNGRTLPQQFTVGDHSDNKPRWSPDGQTIAFLSNRQDEKQAQIYLLPFSGGEARPLTNLKGSFATYAWSPDGTKIVCQFRKKEADVLAREADTQKQELGIVARHITRLFFKNDGGGYASPERWHIWTVNVATGRTIQLTDGNYDEIGPSWSPDGQQILCLSNRSDDPDQETDADALWLIAADGGALQPIKTRYGRKLLASFAPDGQQIAYLGREQRGRPYQNTSLYIVPTAGGSSTNLSAGTDLHLGLATLTDTGSNTPQTPPVWSRDGRCIYVQASAHGNQSLMSFTVDKPGHTTSIINAPGTMGGFSFDTAQTKIAYLWGTMNMVGQVWLHDLAAGNGRALSTANQDLFNQRVMGDIAEVSFTGQDGHPLQGWILFPPNFDPTQQYPSILEIHGGPMTQYGRSFMHEFYYLAAQGYVVYWSNPRGSQGYGEDFCGAIYNNWGTVDFDDVMAWTDYMARQPYVDTGRMGVTGGSYGGYMTALIIGRSTRFQAAIAQRVVSNFVSFYGSSDMNWLAEGLLGSESTPWADLANYWRQSPISTIGNTQTPTLVMHSEQDLRCAQEQGEQLFVALKRLGVETELILFPDESHGLSRNGRTDRRIARLQHMARWFEKYLKHA